MRTANPALSDDAFRSAGLDEPRASLMTVNGAVFKTGVLAALLVAAAGVAWSLTYPGGLGSAPDQTYKMGFLFGGLIGGLVFAMVTIFAPKAAPVTAPLYAVCEGLFLGIISSFFAAKWQGIVLQAAVLTVGVLGVMLLAYTSGLIRATEKFKLGVIAATGAICLFYLATMLLGLFGVGSEFRATVYGAGPIGIGISVVVCIVAALNLVLDFDVIETGARYGAPKYMEWYAAFGLMVTLVWLYLEILRLLAKLRSSD